MLYSACVIDYISSSRVVMSSFLQFLFLLMYSTLFPAYTDQTTVVVFLYKGFNILYLMHFE